MQHLCQQGFAHSPSPGGMHRNAFLCWTLLFRAFPLSVLDPQYSICMASVQQGSLGAVSDIPGDQDCRDAASATKHTLERVQ